MAPVLIAGEAAVRQAVSLDLAVVDAVEDAFRALDRGDVEMPPILSMALEDRGGELDAKTAYVPGLESFAFKISTGFFGNAALGLPSLSGLMVVFSAVTGEPQAVLLDNGYLTDVRTAAAGAVAARHLARADARSAAILGTGLQARLQLRALTLVRPIERAVIWGRDPARAERAAAEMAEALGLEVRPEASPERAVRGADIVVTTTPARAPILMSDWLEPGQHVTAMGSDAAGKTEIDPGLFARAAYVADRLAQTRVLGELRAAIAAGVVAPDAAFPELGQVIAGRAPGRSGPEAITLADLTGTGVQDTAIATLALGRLRAAGTATTFDS